MKNWYAQKNTMWKFCDDVNMTINPISECFKLVRKEYQTWHDWVGKLIHWELCKSLKFDQADTWYIHKPESIRENETQKILWDFEIKMDHPTSTRRLDLILFFKYKKTKTKTLVILWILSFQWTIELKKSKWKDKQILEPY